MTKDERRLELCLAKIPSEHETAYVLCLAKIPSVLEMARV